MKEILEPFVSTGGWAVSSYSIEDVNKWQSEHEKDDHEVEKVPQHSLDGYHKSEEENKALCYLRDKVEQGYVISEDGICVW